MRKERGFTLIELMLAMGLAFMVFLVIYMAYFISSTFFQKGTDALQEQMYVRGMFSRITDDLKYLTRVNALDYDRTELEFEVFNNKVLETDPDTSDKRIQGSVIYYHLRATKDYEGNAFKIFERKEDNYEWWLKFGHSQVPNDNTEPYGYPDDMRDPVTGKQMTTEGEYTEIIEQEEKKEFLLDNVVFTPFDNMGAEVDSGSDYDTLKTSRAIKVEISYKLRGRYGETLSEKTQFKTVSQMVPFVNFMTEDSMLAPLKSIFGDYAMLGKLYFF